MKKWVSSVLCIIFVIQMAVISMASEFVDKPYIIVNTGNGNEEKYTAINRDGEIYLAAEDIAAIAGYVCDNGEHIGFAKEPGSSFYQFDVDFNGNVHMRGHEFKVQVEKIAGKYFLPLEKILYLMHANWCVEDNVLYVNPLPYALPDFFADFYGDFRQNLTTDGDILMNGENNLLRSVRSSLTSMVRDFDIRYYIPVWGANEMIEEDYEKILLNLTETKESYIGELPTDMVEAELEGTLLSEISEENGRLKFVVDLPLKVDDLDTAIETYGKSSGIARKIAGNVALDEILDRDQLKKISDQVGEMADAISYFTSVCNVVDVLRTADSMNESFLQQLEILKNFDGSRYEGSAVFHIKNAAADLIRTKEDKVAAVSEQALEETLNIVGGNAVGMTFAGKLVAAVQTADMALSVLSDDYANSMEAATISYMLGQSVNLEFIALREMERYVQEMNNLGYQYTAENAEKIRSAALLYLNLNLRDKSYIYYLNSINNETPDWENSDQAKEMKKEIAKVQAMRAALISTEEYDRLIVVGDLERMYSDEPGMVREKVSADILREGKEDVDQIEKNSTIQKGMIYEYDSKTEMAQFSIEVYDGNEVAELGFWSNNGNNLQFFSFPWVDGKCSYQTKATNGGQNCSITITPKDQDTVEIKVLNQDDNEVWSDYEYQLKGNADNFSESKITQEQAIELARQKMGDSFGYVYSKMLEYQGVKYYVILVKGSVDEPGAPVTTLTKIFVSEDGAEVREGAEITKDGVNGIEFYE